MLAGDSKHMMLQNLSQNDDQKSMKFVFFERPQGGGGVAMC
jgi:hypothetical protein